MRHAPASVGLLIVAFLGGQAVGADDSEEATQLSARSQELLRYDCTSDLGRREITLFGDGTVRLRTGHRPQQQLEPSSLGQPEELDPGRLKLYLGSLSPEELAVVLRRLAAEDLSATPQELAHRGQVAPVQGYRGSGVDGSWIQTCRLTLDLPRRPAKIFRFSEHDSLDLPLSRVVSIAEELEAQVEGAEAGEPGIPEGYEPRMGDVLQHLDGALYEVVGWTTDGSGLELEGVTQPTTFFIAIANLPTAFATVVRRGDAPLIRSVGGRFD